jgi:hypothetical protein
MARKLYRVISNPVPGRESELNGSYDNRHTTAIAEGGDACWFEEITALQ